MSIKGFSVNGVVHKYDYNALDNIPANPSGGGGITEDVAEALLNCFQNVAWSTVNGQTYYTALQEALEGAVGQTYSITYNLSNVTLSNMATSITEGSTYTATVTVPADYELGSVTATMGGTTVTGAYSNGYITIPNVSGNLVITAVSTQRSATLSSISAIYTGGTVYTTTALNDLKSDLTVTATWSDNTTSPVPSSSYALSVSGGGSLVVGSNTIVVSYTAGGVTKTDTFSVTAEYAPLIPTDYTQVEYINRPSGSAVGVFINTGRSLSKSGTVTIVAEFMATAVSSYSQNIVGIRENVSSSNVFGLAVGVTATEDGLEIRSGDSSSVATLSYSSSIVNQRITATATASASSVSISDGANTETETLTTKDYSGQPICIFGVKKTTSQVNNPFVGNCYYIKITENGTDVLELIPCKRDSDDAAGFYDRVNNTFLTNASLVAGPEVE